MAISHVLSSPIADFTGTVTVFNSAGQTTTANATQIVRPSDWNSAHNQFSTFAGNTAGQSTMSGTNIVLAGGANITLSGNGSTVSVIAPTQTAFVLSNSNGLTFGTNGSTVTASHNGLTTARASNDAIGLNTAGTNVTWTVNSSGLSLNASGYAGTNTAITGGAAITLNSSGLSFNGSGLAGTGTTTGGANISLSATLNSAGLNLSASVAPAGAVTLTGYATGNTVLSSTGTIAGSSLVVRGSNGISAGVSNGSIVVDGPALTSLSVTGALSASSNGSTISLGVGTVTASAVGNTILTSSGTINLNGPVVSGAGILSAGYSNGTIVLSVPSGGGAGDGVNILAAGTQTAATTGTVLFNNSNGITFGMSNSSVITASHNGLTTARASNDAIGLNTAATNVTWTVNSSGLSLNASGYAGTATAITGGALITLNSAGLSFNGNALAGTGTGFTGGASISGSMTLNTAGLSLSLSHPAWITTQSGQAFSAGGGSSAFQTLSFSNANGASFTNTNGQVGLSYSVPVVSNAIQPVGSATGSGTNVSRFAADDHVHEGVFSVGVSTGGNTAGDTRVGAGRFVLAGGANITLSQATAAGGLNTISIVGGAGGGGGMGISAGTQSVSTGTMVFADSNGITFGMSNSNQITASYNSTQFAGTGTTFAGANISASMTLNSNGLNLSASVAAPGAAAEANAINLLGANTAGNTTATGSTIGWSGVNLTLSGTNASQVVISAPGTSSLVAPFPNAISTDGSTISIGHATYSGYNPYHDLPMVVGQPGQGTLQLDPEEFPNFQFDRLVFGVNNSNATNSSGSHTLSFWVGFYTRNASSLSLLTSTSTSLGLTHSGTVGSYSFYSGLRIVTIPMTSTFTAGEYVVGFLSRTTSGGANGTYSNLLGSNLNSNFLGHFGSSHATTAQLTLGQGVYSATTSAMPASIAFSQIRGSDSAALRPVYIHMMSGTV